MRLNEITKERFVQILKDPFMAKVNTGVGQIMRGLGKAWELHQEPTYHNLINDLSDKMEPDYHYAVVFKLRRIFTTGSEPSYIKSEMFRAEGIIVDVFVDSGIDNDQEWGTLGQDIRTITCYLWPADLK